jgi:hypothetical protein
MVSVASIFSTPPDTWGYRGDPFLWDALGWEISNRISQKDQSFQETLSLEPALTNTFRSLINGGQKQGDGLALKWLPVQGMSGGIICPETWNNKLLPELSARFRAAKRAVHDGIEYHHAEHRFRFAAWAAATAARSSRKVCTFPVSMGAQLLRNSNLRWLALGSHWLPRSRDEFDHAHHQWCEEILHRAQNDISKSFTYGIAAKLVNCYLKALFLQTMAGSPFDPNCGGGDIGSAAYTRYLHPPIDRILMEEAARRSDAETKKAWKQLIGIGWSNFTGEDYKRAIKLSRKMVGEDVAQIEACWIGFQ